jgi:chitinase
MLHAGRADGGGRTAVGYYPDWNRSSYPPSMILYRNLTHVAHAFIIPNTDGSLGGTSGFAFPALLQSAHQAGVKVVVSLGGWGQSGGFSPMAADTAARRKFVQNVKAFCQTNGYDGVDLDWEYPANITDRANLTILVHELRQAFAGMQPPLSISMAVPAGNWTGQWFDFASMVNDIDWLGIMTYDYYGSWTSQSGPNSPLYGSWSVNNQGWVDDSFTYYSVTRGVPPAKLLIGVPFYGWVFTAATMYGASTGASQKHYQSIAPLINQGWTRYWDSEGRVPYLINSAATQVISYDDTASLRVKCDYIVAKGIQGAMVWAIGQDNVGGGQPLLDALGRGLGLVTAVSLDEGSLTPTSFVLYQNYPNPFNPTTTIRFSVPSGRADRPESVEQIPNSQYETSAAPPESGFLSVRFVSLRVYDVLGREVATLVNDRLPAGTYAVPFNASALPSGVYFYRLQAGTSDGRQVQVETKKLVLAK